MQTFNDHIYGDRPVLVDFFANWCGPCKMVTPVLKDVKEIAGDRATVLKIDVDKNPDLSAKFYIQSIPTLILFKKGDIVWRKSGLATAAEIMSHLRPHL